MKIDQILKWLATATLIVGTGINGLGFFPLGPIILIVGGLMWLAVSIMWKENSLIVTNSVMSLTGLATLSYTLLK
jgi:hypothetical protein